MQDEGVANHGDSHLRTALGLQHHHGAYTKLVSRTSDHVKPVSPGTVMYCSSCFAALVE